MALPASLSLHLYFLSHKWGIPMQQLKQRILLRIFKTKTCIFFQYFLLFKEYTQTFLCHLHLCISYVFELFDLHGRVFLVPCKKCLVQCGLLYSVQCTCVHWTLDKSLFTKNTRPCLTCHPVFMQAESDDGDHGGGGEQPDPPQEQQMFYALRINKKYLL